MLYYLYYIHPKPSWWPLDSAYPSSFAEQQNTSRVLASQRQWGLYATGNAWLVESFTHREGVCFHHEDYDDDDHDESRRKLAPKLLAGPQGRWPDLAHSAYVNLEDPITRFLLHLHSIYRCIPLHIGAKALWNGRKLLGCFTWWRELCENWR